MFGGGGRQGVWRTSWLTDLEIPNEGENENANMDKPVFVMYLLYILFLISDGFIKKK